jgi:ABC-2 type transport system ATP-binding protein
MSDVVLAAEHLSKTFAVGFFRKKVRAVEDLSLEVKRGEIFGFLGPNGAGKTTTIKMLMGLIFPTSGSGHVLGKPIGNLEAKRRLGFLPETPYFYDYLTAEEFLDLAGALADVPKAERKKRADALIERVGLGHARGRALRKFSKGMLQRVGIAQALMHEPELVVLDEPMTGLDPIGRKEMRDLILSLRKEGKTIFFSTHILSDVELLCDRVGIVVGGKIRDVGKLTELLSPRLLATEVVLRNGAGEKAHSLPGDADVDAFVKDALARGEHLVSVTPRRESLEDLFVRESRK